MKRVAYENNAGGIVSELNKKTQEYNLKDFKFKGSITATPKKLTDVIDNDKLFAANPALKDVMILYVNIGNLQGAVSSDLKYIYQPNPIRRGAKKNNKTRVDSCHSRGKNGIAYKCLYGG